jgi:uncharacterized protein (DUF2342 family)
MWADIDRVSLPTATEIVRFMGWPASTPAETKESVADAVTVAALAAQAYTRGRGFDQYAPFCAPDIAAVITSSAARLASNPTNAKRIEAGSFNTVPGTFEGWTLAELAILHNYRRRTA